MTTVHPPTIDAAPVLFLIGYGFRPAYQPADYVGPRLDCAMWLPTPEADMAYRGKFDAPPGYMMTEMPVDPLAVLAHAASPQITAASLAGPTPGPAVWHPSTPSQPWWPSEPNWPEPCCIIIEPDTPLPPIAPVPVPAAAPLLLTAVVALAWLRRRA